MIRLMSLNLRPLVEDYMKRFLSLFLFCAIFSCEENLKANEPASLVKTGTGAPSVCVAIGLGAAIGIGVATYIFSRRSERSNPFMDVKEQLHRKAYHEAGHALIAALLDIPIDKFSIRTPKKAFVFEIIFGLNGNKAHYTKKEFLRYITYSLGGYAAEQVVLGSETSGAYDDLKFVNETAGQMVKNFGMGLDGVVANGLSSEDSKRAIDNEIIKIIQSQLSKAKWLLTKYKNFLEIIAEELLLNKVISATKVYEILGNNKWCEASEFGSLNHGQ